MSIYLYEHINNNQTINFILQDCYEIVDLPIFKSYYNWITMLQSTIWILIGTHETHLCKICVETIEAFVNPVLQARRKNNGYLKKTHGLTPEGVNTPHRGKDTSAFFPGSCPDIERNSEAGYNGGEAKERQIRQVS